MSFSCLIAVARTCSTILNANGKSWHSYPVEKFGTFHHWVWCWLWVFHIRMVCIGFACGSAGKETAHNVGDLGSIPGLGWSPAEGKGYPLQYPSLENSTDCIVPGLTKSRTRLSDFHFTYMFPLYLLCWEFLSQIRSFGRSVFCIHWDDHMIFTLPFVNVFYHFDWLCMLKHSCIPWMNHIWQWYVINHFNCYWIQFSNAVLRTFQSIFIRYRSLVFFSCSGLILFSY